ncbi:hypothetical protein HY947_04700 [Candidatus Gottesmanbacteria bacterium]|nr:hypothetical protein [Candidatus Gottesmanbacteria bacterium]
MDQPSISAAQQVLSNTSTLPIPNIVELKQPPVGQSPLPTKEHILFRFVGFGIFSIFLLIVFGYVYVSRNSMTVHDQALGEFVIIDQVFVASPRGARIKLSINGVSKGGTMVGFSPWLPRGTHSYIGIPLGVSNIENRQGNEIIRPKAGETVYVSLHDVDILEQGITSENSVLRDVIGRPVVRKLIVQ